MTNDRPPFFVVGTGRSGTTMLRNLLRLHPRVHLPRETHWIPILFNSFGLRRVPVDELIGLVQQVYMAKGRSALERILAEEKIDDGAFSDRLRATLPADGLASIAEFMNGFRRIIGEHRGRDLIGDKTPDYGLCMGTLQAIWPEARFLHIGRDGRDVAMSMSKVLSFRLLAAWGINHWWAIALQRQYEIKLDEADAEIPLERFFELWHSRIMRIRDERNRLRPGTYLEVSYEDLLSRSRETLNRIAEFLEFPEAESWIDASIAQIAGDNLGKNRARPEFRALTERYGEVLAPMGFAV
jgi:hypothetical protein